MQRWKEEAEGSNKVQLRAPRRHELIAESTRSGLSDGSGLVEVLLVTQKEVRV